MDAHVESKQPDGKVYREEVSRRDGLIGQGIEPRTVQLEPDEQHLLSTLIKIGPTRPAGMGGIEAVGWLDIWAFSQLTFDINTPGEAEILRGMALAYADGLEAGRNPLGIEPIDQDT